MPGSDGLPVFIWEIDDLAEGEFLQLAGPDLPEQGVPWGGRQRLSKTLYPGSRRASVQVLGTEEDDIVLQGRYCDVWVGRIGHALEQRAKAERLRHRQRYCELAWGEDFVVRGFLKEARHTVVREGDITYEYVFDVSESDEARVIAAQEAGTMVQGAGATGALGGREASQEDLRDVIDRTLDVLDEWDDDVVGAINVIQAVRR